MGEQTNECPHKGKYFLDVTKYLGGRASFTRKLHGINTGQRETVSMSVSVTVSSFYLRILFLKT
jgi:hypothetical protein